MPLDISELRKKHGQLAQQQKKPPLTNNKKNIDQKSVLEDDLFSDQKENRKDKSEDLNLKKKLIKQLFNDNEDYPVEEILLNYFTQGDGKKMGKTVSPLKGIREGLEDMLNIQQLQQLVNGFRGMKTQDKKKEEDEPMENNNMMTMLPLLQKMQGAGGQGLDPMMMMMLMGMGNGQKQNNGNFGQLFMMMSMMNMFAQNQQPQQADARLGGNGATPSTSPNVINAEMIKALYTELQNVMQQGQTQKPAIDPVTLMLINAINKSSNTPQNLKQNDDKVVKLLEQFTAQMNQNQSQTMAMMLQQQNDKFERGMEMIAGALHRDKPEDKFFNNFKMFKEIFGETRSKNVAELDFELKRQELDLKRQERLDMLDREERDKIREAAKSERFMSAASGVLDKVIGSGLGNIVSDVMKTRKSSGERRGRAVPEQNFDPNLLDDL